MNSTDCMLCKFPNSLCRIWSTSRYFDREQVLKGMQKESEDVSESTTKNILNEDYVVCGYCVTKYKILYRNML